MLTKQERDDVIAALAQHLGLTPVGPLIQVVFTLPDRAELGEINTQLNTATDQAAWIVDSCIANRWRRNPSLLELLLNRLVNNAGFGALAPILTRVQQKIDPNPNPFDSLWVLASQPFLSRPDLRAAAKALVEGVNQPIMRVNGPSKSGKTYTTQLFSFVMSEAWPDLHVVPVELAPETGPTYKVEELAESLTLTMVTDDPPERSTSSFPKALARWLVRNVNRNKGVWIFVLDGFGQPNVQAEVTELIRVLAEYTINPEFARKMRLVLLDYDQDLIGNWRAWTVDEGPLQLNGVTESDLIDCLQAFNNRIQSINPAKMIAPTDIPTIAKAMLAKAQTEPPQLPSLYNQLLKIAK